MVSKPTCRHCAAGVQLFKWCRNLSAGTVLQRCSCLSGVEIYLPALFWRGAAVSAVSKPICRHCVAEVQLFKRCHNQSAWHCAAGVQLLKRCRNLFVCRLFKRCQFLPPEQVRWAELDILLYFYFRTDQVKRGHMQLLLFSSAFFFLLREIYSFRMSTSEFDSIILLNKESLHLISVDPI